MKSDKFFRWVWNFNGLALSVGLISILLFIAYQIKIEIFKDKHIERPSLNLAEDVQNDENWSLGYPERITGTSFYFIPLESDKLTIEKKDNKLHYFSGGSHSRIRWKNVVFINSTSNEAKWLFKSTEQIIVDISPQTKGEFNVQGVARVISYEVINNDTNKDGKLSYADKRSYALSKIDGSGYTEIVSGYNQIIKSALNPEGNLFVVYITNNEVHSMVVDINTFTVVSKKIMPKVEEAQ